MAGNAVLLQHVRRLAASAATDEQLLADYLARQSDDAFAAILGRHGPMVFNVCRRILHDAHAAEDVFQATFAVLARRAGAIHRRASVAGFLHGVAYRLAVRARKRRVRELPASLCDNAAGPAEQLTWKEMLGILDDELGRLPEPYRTPLVLCYLEGRTQDEAARQLGRSLNTLRRRLARGRRLLEARLRGRGVTLETVLAGLLAASAAGVPGRLQAATLAAAGVSARRTGYGGTGIVPHHSGRKLVAVVAAALGAAVCFGYCLTPSADQGPGAEEPAPAPADADPLPARGTVRLGTDRYRLGTRIESLSVSADGRHAAAASGWDTLAAASVFDLNNGRCLGSLDPDERGSGIEAVGLSPDGTILVTKDHASLRFYRAGTEVFGPRRAWYSLDTGSSRAVTNWVTFTPNGLQVAVTLNGDEVTLIDVTTGQVKQTFSPKAAVSACVFSPDGRWMATGGYEKEDGVYLARLWEVSTGKELRRFPAGNSPAGNGAKRALAFSPDGATLAGGGFGDGRLHLWGAATGKELATFPGGGGEIQSVAFAPNGKTVALAADSIHFYDPVTGKEQLRIDRRARGLAFDRDGSVLTGAVSGAIYRWDAASGRQLTPDAAQDSGVTQILVSADGRSVFTADQEGGLQVWDVSGRIPPHRIADGVERGFAASRDGKFLAWTVPGDRGGSRVRLYDVAGRQLIDRLPSFAEDASVAAFLPDGKTLLTLGRGERPATARLWDVESGKELRSFLAASEPDAKPRGAAPLRSRFPFYTTRRVALSPDGKTLAIGLDWVRALHSQQHELAPGLWDVATGKAGRELSQPEHMPAVLKEAGTGTSELSPGVMNRRMKFVDGRAFSPDGRLLADWAENPFGRSRMDHVCVWDVATGRAVATLADGQRPGAADAAFSPDGRNLATALADGTVLLWEVATWRIRAEFRGHRDRVTALAFGPDGRLFTGGLDTVIRDWDVRPPQTTRGTLADAWDALTDTGARVAFQAQGRFLAEPDKAVEWFTARIPPARLPEPARLKDLIADLDKEEFATRERATAELRELGPAAAAALRGVVSNSPSAEVRGRAGGLLYEMENGVIPPSKVRALRAVEVLEWIASPEARALLREVAKGAPGDRLTRGAAAASKRPEGRR